MLKQVNDPVDLLSRLRLDAPRDWLFVNSVLSRGSMTLLADNPNQPSVFVAHEGARFMFHAVAEDGTEPPTPQAAVSFSRAANALADGAVEQEGGWPGPDMLQAFVPGGRNYLFVDSSPVQAWKALVDVGFEPHEDSNDHVADLYFWEGQPRLSGFMRHSCRLGRGQELWDELRSGVGYDPDGYYVRMILERMPSFVCEVGGEPVCWSTQHLNGSMGMIYTPKQHRRKGYGRSLAAFQIDHNLRRSLIPQPVYAGATGEFRGRACCHVVRGNTASEEMCRELEGTSVNQSVVWRSLYWPAQSG